MFYLKVVCLYPQQKLQRTSLDHTKDIIIKDSSFFYFDVITIEYNFIIIIIYFLSIHFKNELIINK